jgi:integrase
VNITRLVCNRYLKPYDAWSIPEFTPLALQELRDAMIAKPLHRTTINKYCAVVKAAFKWGVSQTMVPVQAYQALACVEGLEAGRSNALEPEPVRPVPEAHIEKAKRFLPHVLRTMIDLQLATGARPGEIYKLRPLDIDRSTCVRREPGGPTSTTRPEFPTRPLGRGGSRRRSWRLGRCAT